MDRLAAGMAVLWLALCGAAAAEPIDTKAREAILVDATTGTVLFEKNADERMPPASMSKIMTVYMLFEALKAGRITLDDSFPVSERAWRTGGSKSFVKVGDRVRVEDLIQGIIVQSGNDAAIVAAEGLAGSEEEFARRMNEQAKALGLTGSHFANANGLPDPEHYSTVRDLANLAAHLIRDFPEYYHYFSETEFTFNGIKQQNRNPLLGRDIGVDGLKTGHTQEAGYCLTASAVRDGRRLILVITGLPSEQARSEEAERLLDWGFREFDTLPLFKAGEVIDEPPTWMGSPGRVPLTVAQDLAVTLPRGERDKLKLVVRVTEPVPAPIEKGTPVGVLAISAGDAPTREVPLVAAVTVERQGFIGRVGSSVAHLAFGWLD